MLVILSALLSVQTMAYKILILTDHLTHTKENSLYVLANELKKHSLVAQLDIASRGNTDNHDFFYAMNSYELKVASPTKKIKFQQSGKQFLSHTNTRSLIEYDFVFLRLPRPIPLGFFHFLGRYFDEQHIINRPSGILETSNKSFLLQVEHLCPPIRLCRTMTEVWEFQRKFPIVLKPLEDYGGKGIVKVKDNFVYHGKEVQALFTYEHELQKQLDRGGYLAMKFMKNVGQGDKRVVVVNGKVLGASLRLPPEGSWLCNASQGGSSHETIADEQERWMAEELHKVLAPKGIGIFGMDTLVDDDGKRILSEVNTLSIGGIKQIQKQSKTPIVEQTAHELMQFAIQQIETVQT